MTNPIPVIKDVKARAVDAPMARRMTRKIGEFHRQPSEARAQPLWLGSPFFKLFEKGSQKRLGTLRRRFSRSLYPDEGVNVLMIEHGRDKRVLAVEVIVKRSLGDAGGLRHGVHAHPREPFLIEMPVCGAENPLPRVAR